jgi:peptidyl-prolyl cis-trans isomerase A (cyclophilin A)/peptidyl-prolyl cis-trans isomerase B (cyclophilin B)
VLPEVWARITRVGSQTKFEGPTALRAGENRILVENGLDAHDFKWRFRLVDQSGTEIAACDLAAENIFGERSATWHTLGARTLGGVITLPAAPKGRLLTAEFMIADVDGKTRRQRVRSPQFVEGALRPRVRLKTPRGDLVIELDRTLSPPAVEAFLDHVRKGDYDGTVFHENRNDQFVRAGAFDERLQPRQPPLALPAEWTKPKPTSSKMAVALTGQAEFLIHIRNNPSLKTMIEPIEIGKVVEGEEAVGRIARDLAGSTAKSRGPLVAITKAVVELE